MTKTTVRVYNYDWFGIELPSDDDVYAEYGRVAESLFGTRKLCSTRTVQPTYIVTYGHLLFKNEADRTFFLLNVS